MPENNINDNVKKVHQLKAVLDKAKENKAKAEATIEQLQVREEELIESMKKMGVTPETIAVEIANLEKSINENITAAEALIPLEYQGMMK